jgi:trans-aconitate methyltransferase
MRPDPTHVPVDLRTDVPHTARVYDFILGGKDNFPADRAAAEQALAGWPSLSMSMRQSRAFMIRAARYLAADAKVDQFLDIGTGIPTSPNLHEVVHQVRPEARVVYVDNDPIVLAHARALLVSEGPGRTAYLDADMRQPHTILKAPELRDTLDLSRPVALSIVAVVQFVPDDVAFDVVAQLMEALPSGSYLALSTVTADSDPDVLRVVDTYNDRGMFAVARTKDQVERFFDGLQLVEPGVTLVHRWRPDPDTTPVDDNQVAMYGAIARKP